MICHLIATSVRIIVIAEMAGVHGFTIPRLNIDWTSERAHDVKYLSTSKNSTGHSLCVYAVPSSMLGIHERIDVTTVLVPRWSAASCVILGMFAAHMKSYFNHFQSEYVKTWFASK